LSPELGSGIRTFDWTSLPDGWELDLLGKRAKVRRGSSPRPAGDPRYFGDTIPWIKIGDATKNGCRFLESTEEFVNEDGARHSVRIPAGSLIVSNSGVSLGFATITRIGGCIHDGWLLLTDFERLDRDFLYYCINYLTPRIRRFADGTTQPNLNTDIARRLLLPLPPLREQKLIASILGSLDDKIELNRRMNGTLEAMARAIFKSWFVDFDPVRAKMEGRQPVGMDAETSELFVNSFEDSLLGHKPTGWRIQRLVQVTRKIGSGATPRGGADVYLKEGIALIRSQNVHDHDFQALFGNRTHVHNGFRSGTQLHKSLSRERALIVKRPRKLGGFLVGFHV
jgi:type I restriction enzyme S subunit